MESSTHPTWTTGRLAAHHLAPGLATLALFVPLALMMRDTGVPTTVALFLAILLGEVPASWWLMRRAARREGASFGATWLFPWRGPTRLRTLLLVGPLLALGSMVVVFGVAGALEPAIRDALFAWVPDALVLDPGPMGLDGASRFGLLTLWLLSGIVGVGIGGVTQELYHRGFLLPRSEHLGAWAVPFNAILFGAMHLTAPWGWPFFAIAGLLWAWATRHFRSMYLGLIGHVGMLALGWIMMTLIVFGLVPLPTS